MATEKVSAQIVVETDKQSLKQSEEEIKRLASPESIKMAVDLGSLRRQLEVVKQSIKQARAADDLTAEIKFRGDAEILKKQITQANRELTNFVRTGDKEVSVLGKLFQQVGVDINSGFGKVLFAISNTFSTAAAKAATSVGTASASMGNSIKNVSNNIKNVNNDIKNTTNNVTNVVNNFNQLGSAAEDASTSIFTLGTALIAAAAGWLIAFGVAAINLWDKLEQSQISFETMLGSATKAKQLLGELSSFAANTPFEIQGIRDSAKQLLAYGIAQEDIIGTLKILGDVSAGVGKPLSQIALTYGQVRTAGKLYAQDLNQFTQAGIPIIAQLAKQFNITEAEVRKFVEDGKIGFADVQKAFIAMTSEGGLFFNLMQKQSQSLTGKISNLKDQFNIMLEKVGSALIPFAKAFVGALSSILSFFQSTAGKAILLATAAGALGATIAIITPVIFGLGTALATAAASGTVLAGVMAIIGWPVTLTALAFAALWGGIYYATQASQGLSWATEDLQRKINDLRADQEALNDAHKDGTLSQKEYDKSLKSNKESIGSLEKAIEDVKNGTVSYEIVKERVNKLKKIKDTAAYDAETLAIQAQIDKLKELLKTKSIVANQSLQSLNEALGAETPVTGQGSLVGNIATDAQLKRSWEAAAAYEKARVEADKAKKEIDSLEASIKAIDAARNKTKLPTWAGGGGGDGWKKDTAAEKLKKAEAALKKQAALEIQEVKNSTLSEKRKAEVILAIKDKLEKDIKDLQGKSIDNEFNAAKEKLDLIKETEKKKAEIKKDALEYTKKLLKDELDANKDALDKTKDRIKALQDQIKDYNENTKKSLELAEETAQKVADRYKTIGDEIERIQEKQSEATQQIKDYANALGNTVFDKQFDNQKLGDTDVKDIREYVKEQQKLLELQKEQKLAKENTTEANIKSSNLSETEKILAEKAKKQKEIDDEKKAIQDRLGLKQSEAEEELKIAKLRAETLIITGEEYQKAIDGIEGKLTETVRENTKARMSLYAQEEARLRKLIAFRTEAGLPSGAISGNTTNTTTNNSPTVVVNATVSNSVDVSTLGKGLANEINLANKGINK